MDVAIVQLSKENDTAVIVMASQTVLDRLTATT